MWRQQKQPCYPIKITIPILICKFHAIIAALGSNPLNPALTIQNKYLESFYPLHLRRICPKVGCHYGHPERLQKHWVLRLNSFPPPVWMLEQCLIISIEKKLSLVINITVSQNDCKLGFYAIIWLKDNILILYNVKLPKFILSNFFH